MIKDQSEKTLTSSLHKGIEACQRVCRPMLRHRELILKEYANGFFDEQPRVRKPMNKVYLAVTVLLPLLASANPRAMVRPRILALKPFGDTYRLTLNYLSQKIKFGLTLREVVLDALTYIGITKTGLVQGGSQVEDIYGYLHDAGQIYTDRVDPEDYVFDVIARRREEMDYEGNSYILPIDFVRDSGQYMNYDKVNPVSYMDFGGGHNRPELQAKNKTSLYEVEEIRPYCRVFDMWLPHENIIVTLPAEGEGDRPLKIMDYGGPERGPYDTVRFNLFPESIISIPPIYSWLDLHEYLNTFARKMARSADRDKTILAYSGTASDDAKQIVDARDGESVRVDDVNALKEIKFGGVREDAYPYIQWLDNVWSEAAGNMNLVRGLKPQAETLGQEQMLMGNASITIDDMAMQTHLFVKEIFKKWGWYIWTDPLIDVQVIKRLPGLQDIQVSFTPEAREGGFLDYNVDVEPYSYQRMSPAMRRRSIMEIVTGVILPLADLSIQQGAVPNVPALVKSLSRDLDLTEAEIDEFYQMVTPNMSSLGPYPPQQGQVAPQSNDALGASDASRTMNSVQQQNRAGMKSSPSKDRADTGA